MTRSRFFQVSLFFPLLLWCACLLVLSLMYEQGARFFLDNLATAYRVFVPYFIYAALLWRVAHGKPYRSLILLASVVPIVWGVFFVLFYILMSVVRRETMEPLHILAIMAFWATVVGYLLELIPLFLLNMFKESFRPESESPASAQPERTSESAAGSVT